IQMFLREYIDKLFDETLKVLKKRKRSYSNQYALEKTPFNALKWALIGYNGPIKEVVKRACHQRSAISFNHQEEK
ncbi:13794_t:CDS:1, partial [Funneliformis caledonium]